MKDLKHFYMDGAWVEASPGSQAIAVVNPVTEENLGSVALGTLADVDHAVAAARRAFPAWSATPVAERIAALERLVVAYKDRAEDIAQTICDEIGAPLWLCRDVQAATGLAQLAGTLEALREFAFEDRRGSTLVVREGIGVCALITPWNWPMNQVAAKVAPALAAGCTIVLKPSELAPFNARVFAEICDAAELPSGVFNMVYGDGPGVGHALSTHADVDLISITGSTRAGIQVAMAAANSVKRVTQELGGKSANILLADADLNAAIPKSIMACMLNSGQTCTAPTRLLVPQSRYADAVGIAQAFLGSLRVGDPRAEGTQLGPVSCAAQFERVQSMIELGLNEGARAVVGGLGRPEGLTRGFYVRPTLFADVHNGMAIAREEVFGPVLVMIPYKDEQDAVQIANDSDYGLAGYVWSADPDAALRIARQLRTGSVRINGAPFDWQAPFGGFGKSGNGREFGRYGIAEFLEYKAIMG
ncbi:aldehyde dehydrogenase family protein [Hydrogenophaga sp. BPS33]|uniref:aldehyde dehydrogenase family protein n=1 Tax=Hydrogenophaga sp. BPS33 TaxID=2651974 RepID=UPI00131FEFDF|nr:aldehyde dehydrogenase family protein [Hydrogenophaga sp. BPS33]QHE84627.1 aldehyde dehydrogenase family protein [Hydrogenophaga sp. BPS33]